MVFRPEKLIGAALVASLAAAGAAQANGFARGNADTDIIYEDGNFAARAGVSYTTPHRGYETITVGGVTSAATDGDYSNSYAIPSVAAKFNVTDSLRCAGTYTQPFGADVSYGQQAIVAGLSTNGQGTASTKFLANELALTCGYKFKVGPGNLWILGGGFLEDIHYTEQTYVGTFNPAFDTLTVLDLKEDYQAGFRLGAAFEIPEIALRIQGMYRSEITHNPTGTFNVGSDLGLANPLSLPNPVIANPSAVGNATLPQSFELKAQSGVAPGWLVFGALKWTDWSAFDVLTYTSALGAPESRKEFFFKNGWTYTLGVGHQFNDKIAGSLALTYDTGVSTTEDVNKDIITVAGGLQFTMNEQAKIGVGGAVSHLEGGSVQQAAGCPGATCGAGPGNKFGYTLGDDWAYTIGANLLVKF